MGDMAKVFGNHRQDLERWFDGETNRMIKAKGKLLGFCDDLAQKVLAQVGPTDGNSGSVRHEALPRATVPGPFVESFSVPASPAPIVPFLCPAGLYPPLPPRPCCKHDNAFGNVNLPGAVPGNGSPTSAASESSLLFQYQQDRLFSPFMLHRPDSNEKATAVCSPKKVETFVSVDSKLSAQSMSRQMSLQNLLLYGMDRTESTLSRQPRVPSSIREMTKTPSSIHEMTKKNTFTDSRCFRMVCGGLIVCNSVVVGIAADYALGAAMFGNADFGMLFEGIEIGFCSVFLAELMLRLLCEGCAFFTSKTECWWNIFDAVLISLSLMDVVLTIFQAGKVINLTATRVVRLLRFARILRVVRVMRFFYSFRLIVYSVIHSILCLLWVFGMLLFIMYVFAMFFLHGVSEHFRTYSENNGGAICETELCLDLRHWSGDVLNMVLSLFMSICGGVDWRDFWAILRDVGWVYGHTFIFYIFFMAFGVLNVVVATFVEQSSSISRRDRELVTQNELEKNRQYYNDIRRFFEEADTDGSGTLSWQEFRDYLEDENVQAYFQSFELDVTQAHTLFRLLDLDRSDDVDIDEFVEGCMRMRGQARSIDVHMLLYETEKTICRTVEFMKFVEEKLGGLHAICGETATLSSIGVASNV